MPPSEPDPLIGAIGGALGIIAALMERAKVASIDEFAGALSMYGSATNETQPDEAAIIAQWVLGLYEVAAEQRDKN